MGILNRKMAERKGMKRAGKKVRYHEDGSFRSKWRIIPLTIASFVILCGMITAVIHIPCLLWQEPAIQQKAAVTVPTDSAGVRHMLEYVKDHPSDDFDQDGLTNMEETSHGTDPRDPDTDSDGASDYAEVYLYNTHPCEPDHLLTQQMDILLGENGVSYTSPYKLHDVILWADTPEDRAYGTVIPTISGYRFCSFHGWAQFPESAYAYKVVDGFHIPLEYREAEHAWRIDDDSEIVLFDSLPETAFILTAFCQSYRVVPGALTDLFSLILPKEHSFVTFREVVLEDLGTAQISATATEVHFPAVPADDLSRFGEHTNQLSALTDVYSSILSGKPVAVSLQSPSYGEALLVVYGYTEAGDLLLADREGNVNDPTGNPMLLSIHESAAITIALNGELRQREFFEFSGLGFDSTHGDRLHFIFP